MPFDYFVEWHSFYIWLATIRKIILCVLDIWGFTLKNRVVNNGLLCCPRSPRRVLYRAELHPELRVQMYGFILK